jgi:hypothetical protein
MGVLVSFFFFFSSGSKPFGSIDTFGTSPLNDPSRGNGDKGEAIGDSRTSRESTW